MSAPFCDAAVRQAARARLVRGRAVVERRRSLQRFVVDCYQGEYVMGWVHRVICRELEWFEREVAARRSPRLILQMPPRHGKSELVSKAFPAWFMGRNPGKKVFMGTYGHSHAKRNSRGAKRYATTARNLCDWPHLAPGEVWTTEEWVTVGDNSYAASSIDGMGGGIGGHIILIDDYFKGSTDADSPAKRARAWEWYTSTARARLEPMSGGGVLFVSTRWHEDDPIGRALTAAENDPSADQWRILSFPALADADDPNRHPEDEANRGGDEALAPQLHTTAELKATRASMCITPQGERNWQCVYQQNPTPASGTVFLREWFFQHYDLHPRAQSHQVDAIWISIDSAESDAETAAHTSVQVWGIVGPDKYLLDRHSLQKRPADLFDAIRDIAKSWRAHNILIENKSSGTSLISFLRREFTSVEAFNPGTFGNKAQRAEYAARCYGKGRVFLPQPIHAPWLPEYVDAHVKFPAAKLKDDVDATSQLCIQVDEVYRQRGSAEKDRAAQDDLRAILGMFGAAA